MRKGETPFPNTETPKNGMASNAAGTIPIKVRINEIQANPTISSRGRSGETNKFLNFSTTSLPKRKGVTDMGAKQSIPNQNHRNQKSPAVNSGLPEEMLGYETPNDHLHSRPISNFYDPWPIAPQKKNIG